MEGAILCTIYEDQALIKKITGRSTERIVTIDPAPHATREHDSEAHIKNEHSKLANELTKQMRRCDQFAHRLHLLAQSDDSNASKRQSYIQQNKQAIRAIRKHITMYGVKKKTEPSTASQGNQVADTCLGKNESRYTDEVEQENLSDLWEINLLNKIKRRPEAEVAKDTSLYFVLKRSTEKYHSKAAAARSKAKAEEEKAKKEAYMLKSNGQWKLAKRTVANKITRPLEAVRRQKTGPEGQAKGTVTVNPAEVDEVIREAYGKIYKGNSTDQEKLVQLYAEKYDKHLLPC